jgi:hypothetical protein
MSAEEDAQVGLRELAGASVVKEAEGLSHVLLELLGATELLPVEALELVEVHGTLTYTSP